MKVKSLFFVVLVLIALCGIPFSTQVHAAESDYLVLEQDHTETMELTQDLYVDLNGHTLSGTIVTNGYKIYGMDSATDNYSSANMGYFSCVDAQGNPVVPQTHVKSEHTGSVKRYMTVPTENGYTFHRFYLGITHINLSTATTGVGYRAVFYGDEMVKGMLDAQNAFGYTMQLDGRVPVRVYKPADAFVSGKAVTLRVNGFDAERYGEVPLHARVMVKLKDGTVIESTQNSLTFRSVLETVNDRYLDFTLAQLDAVREMIARNRVLEDWNVDNILNSDPVKVLADAANLAMGEKLGYKATLTGIVSKITYAYSATYKNITLEMDITAGGQTTTMLCFRIKSGAAEVSEIGVGDTITVYGTIINYNGTIEFDNTSVLEKRVGEKIIVDDPAVILADAAKLASGESLPYYAVLIGEVTRISEPYDSYYDNLSLYMDVAVNGERNSVYCYRLRSGVVDASQIAVGDTITVMGIILNYDGLVEFDWTSTLQARVGAPVEPEVTEPTQPTETEPGAPCVNHTDADNNGSCDRCGEDVIVVIDLYAVNDLHGKLADGDNHPGVDELSTYLENARETKDNMILLSSGDMWQGAAASNLTKGAIITDWMNEMDFVSMTIGNHEYDWGEEIIAENAQLAEFPFLAINIYDADTNQRVDYCESSVIVEAEGLQIGIIGAVGNCYSSISSDRTEGVYFKTGSQLTSLVKAEANRLRNQGVDLVIYSLHGDYTSEHYDEALSNGYVDLVFEGHTHQYYEYVDSYGIYHLQGGGDNKGITHASLAYNTANCDYTVTTGEYIPSYTYSSMADHPIVEQLLDKYDEQVSRAYEVLGTTAYMNSAAIGSKVAQLYAQAGEERWGDKYDIVLGGGSLNTRSPYEISAGDVTYGDLMNVLPFDNRLALCSIPGSALLSRFINNSSYYIGYSDYGASIKDSIDSTQTYYVVVDTWSAYYTYNKLTIVEFYDDDVYARDLLADYFRKGG